MEEKFTKSGFPFHDKLPDDYRPATINDFHNKGVKNIGMKYLIQWADNKEVFEICYVAEITTSVFLKPFIDAERVFVNN